MTTQDTNPYRQKVDELLGQKAREEEARKRAEAKREAELQKTVKAAQDRLARIIPQMRDELVRLEVPADTLQGAEVAGWKLGEEFAVTEDGLLYHFPPAPLKAVAYGEPFTRRWVEFNLDQAMRDDRGPVRLGTFHEGNIDYSNSKYVGGFFEYLDGRFFDIVREVAKNR